MLAELATVPGVVDFLSYFLLFLTGTSLSLDCVLLWTLAPLGFVPDNGGFPFHLAFPEWHFNIKT